MKTYTFIRAGESPEKADLMKPYIQRELESVSPIYGEIIRAKFEGIGATKWLNITAEQYEKIKTILSEPVR